jgi:mRNA interferase MazF
LSAGETGRLMPFPDQLMPGDLVMVAFPTHSPGGREQEGTRPAVVAGRSQGPLRFPLVFVVPLTTAGGPWQAAAPTTYPILPAGAAGLPRDSIALTDQLRAIDRGRLLRYLGALTPDEFRPLHAAIVAALGS